jgi:hypothetical protein
VTIAEQPLELGPHAEGPVKRGRCRCGVMVLVVQLADGRPVVLDADEALPSMPCPICSAIERRQAHRRVHCGRCEGRKRIGAPLPKSGVIVDINGRARLFAGRPARAPGEAVHRLHDCPLRDGSVSGRIGSPDQP